MKGSCNAVRLAAFMEKIEHYTRMLVVLACVAVIGSQLLLTQSAARKYLSYADRLEGQQLRGGNLHMAETPLSVSDKSVTVPPVVDERADTRLITVSLHDVLPAEQVFIRIQGQDYRLFVNGEAAMRVREGAIIEIDGGRVYRTLAFTITAPYNDVELPVRKGSIDGSKGIVTIGPVRFKS